jgi:hypothetical protein
VNVLESIGVLFLVASGVAGCSSSSDDGKKVAGRTRSLATAAEPEQLALEPRLRHRVTTSQATGVTEASMSATLRLPGATAVILRLPSGEELNLADEGAGAFGVEVTGTPAQVDARCPDGAYTFMVRLGDGSTTSLTLTAAGPSLTAPTIVTPGDLAIVSPGALPVAWTWPGTAALFDVTLVDVSTGEVAYRAPDQGGREHVVPAEAVAPARRYRLQVTAASGADAAPVRFEAATTVELDVSSGGTP